VISYQRLAEAERYYRIRGYEPVDVSWHVSDKAIRMTCPREGLYFPLEDQTGINHGSLVASAEQSFIQMMLDGTLKPGKYQAISPCFRGDLIDEWHQLYFMKLELCIFLGLVDPMDIDQWETEHWQMYEDAESFFRSFVPVLGICQEPIITLDYPQYCIDICSVNPRIELGSYGIRYHPDVGSWIYGTGCAEPRLSQVIEKSK
jgi:hypothetical protein